MEKSVQDLNSLYTKYLEINEERSYANARFYTIENATKFLFQRGLACVPLTVLDFVSDLMIKTLRKEPFDINDEYVAFRNKYAPHVTPHAIRTKVAYHLRNNYEKLRDNIIDTMHCNIGNDFMGNKNFISQLSILFGIYYDYYYDGN